MLLHLDEVVILLANFITQALATASLYRGPVITVLAADIDHRLRIGVPLVLQCLKAFQAVDLLRVVTDQFLQPLQLDPDLRLGHGVGVQKMLITGNQEPAHAGFKIDCQPNGFVGIADNPVAMLNPPDD